MRGTFFTLPPFIFALLLLSLGTLYLEAAAFAGIHKAPVIIAGLKIKQATNFPLANYRLFKTSPTGDAVAIPFQIDELNEYGDYIMTQAGSSTTVENLEKGNGLFDGQDELVFMGDDVGPIKKPVRWPTGNPAYVYEITLDFPGNNPGGEKNGAVYLAVFFKNIPAPSDKRYVIFNSKDGEVVTSRYRYQFDTQNYLVVRGVDMMPATGSRSDKSTHLLDSSTFYIKADLKYFLTVEVNHRSIRSEIEAYKVGPVRTVVRVTFYYSFLKVNFELGMYTEVSFFSNSVVLPAVLYNPLDGPKSLNTGSGFYYGFALVDNPSDYQIDTNMVPYRTSGLLDFFRGAPKVDPLYWIAASGKDRMMYVEIAPSPGMQKSGILPLLYLEKVDGAKLKERASDSPKPLGESSVNMGLYFDLTRFNVGEHFMAFRLFFENRYDSKLLESFKSLANWQITIARL